jgi:hypothetical protein
MLSATIDYFAPAKIVTRCAYILYRDGNAFKGQAIIAQAYFEDEELVKKVTGAWLDLKRDQKSCLVNQKPTAS